MSIDRIMSYRYRIRLPAGPLSLWAGGRVQSLQSPFILVIPSTIVYESKYSVRMSTLAISYFGTVKDGKYVSRSWQTGVMTRWQPWMLDPDDVRVIFLVRFDPNLYHEYAVASATEYGISRHAALRKMLRPFAGMVSHLG